MCNELVPIATIPSEIKIPIQTPLITSARNYVERLRETVRDTSISLEPKHVDLAGAFADLIIATEPEAADVDQEVVILAVLLHNIGNIRSTPVRSNPQHASSIDAKAILSEIGAPKKARLKVGVCIDNQIRRPLPINAADKLPTEAKVLVAAISASRISQAQSLVSKRTLDDSGQRLQISLNEHYARLGYFPRFQKRFEDVYKDIVSKLENKVAKD